MKSSRIRRGTLLALLLFFLPACASSGARPPEEAAAAPAALAQELRVENYNWATMDVFLVAPGRSYRMGTVETNGSATYVVPPEFLTASDARLLVHPIGSRIGFLSERLPYASGQQIVFRVENNLNLSSFSIR